MSLQVFKALADGEEDSIQPKRPHIEPKPRSPYVPKPKTPQVSKPKTPQPPKQPQSQGQKKQGQQQGNQKGPKGKKQKLNGQASKASAYAKAHKGPPLPPPIDAGTPSMQNGHSSSHALTDQRQALVGQSSQAPPAPPGDNSILPLDFPSAEDGLQPRPQVGFKLAGTKKQKIRLAPEEDPRTAAMHQRLRMHMAKQQQQQQQAREQEQQAQQLEHRKSINVDTTQQAAPDPTTYGVSTSDAVAMDLDNDADDNTDQMNAAVAGQHALLPSHAQTWSVAPSLLPPGLQSPNQQLPDHLMQFQLPQQVPQTVPQQQLPGEASSLPPQEQSQLPGQLQHQLPGQLPQESSRGMHRRRSRRSHRFGDTLLAGQVQPNADTDLNNGAVVLDSDAQQADTSQGLQPQHVTHLPRHQWQQQGMQQQALQSGAGQAWQEPHRTQQPWLDASSGRSSSPALADLAEHGGPVAIANGSAGCTAHAGAQLQVLADDVKSVLR